MIPVPGFRLENPMRGREGATGNFGCSSHLRGGEGLIRSTGIVRRVDHVGRIVLPIELRQMCQIADQTPMEIFIDGCHIVLRKYEPFCIFCGQGGRGTLFHGRTVCSTCQVSLSQLTEI